MDKKESAGFFSRIFSRFKAKEQEKEVHPKKHRKIKEKPVDSLLKELDKRNDELELHEKTILLHEEMLKDVDKEIKKHQRLGRKNIIHLLRKKHQLDKKSILLKEKEVRIHSELKKLRELEKKKHIPRKHLAADREQVLDVKEESLIHRELMHAKHEKELKGVQDTVIIERSKLESLFFDKQKVVEDLKKRHKLRSRSLKENMRSIKRQKQELSKFVKKDLKKLDSKKKELTDAHDKLQKEAKDIGKKKSRITKAQKDLKSKKKAIKSVEEQLKDKEKMILAKEKSLARKERNLKRKDSRLTLIQRSIKNQKASIKHKSIEEKETHTILIPMLNKRKKHRALRQSKKPIKVKAVRVQNIPEMLKEARLRLNSGDIRAADQIIRALELSYNKMHTSHIKNNLRYDLMELKTSLKLSTLI